VNEGFEAYVADLEACDYVAPSGAVFSVEGVNAEEFGELVGGMPALFEKGADDTPDVAGWKRNEGIRKRLFEAGKIRFRAIDVKAAEGDSRPHSELPMLPYSKVKRNDAVEASEFAIGRAGIGTQRAEQIRRSLRQ
jgi:hypothetical protein